MREGLFYLLSFLLFFLFPSKNLVFWHLSCRARCEICSKLTIKTRSRRSGFFIVRFEHIPLLVTVSIVNFEQLIAG